MACRTVVVVGLAQLGLSPFAPRIARHLDLRVMLSIGIAVFAVSMYLTAVLTNQTGFWELFVPQAVRGLGLICCYLPANMIALGTLPADKMKNTYSPIVLATGGKRVLFDTGNGSAAAAESIETEQRRKDVDDALGSV